MSLEEIEFTSVYISFKQQPCDCDCDMSRTLRGTPVGFRTHKAVAVSKTERLENQKGFSGTHVAANEHEADMYLLIN